MRFIPKAHQIFLKDGVIEMRQKESQVLDVITSYSIHYTKLYDERIKYLTEHLKTNKKDHSSRLGLLKLVGQRRRLMRYLKNTDLARWNTIKADLGIRN